MRKRWPKYLFKKHNGFPVLYTPLSYLFTQPVSRVGKNPVKKKTSAVVFFVFFLVYVLLFIKNMFQREKFVLFKKKIKNLKKPQKTFLVGFLGGFFLGFFGWVFIAKPACKYPEEWALSGRIFNGSRRDFRVAGAGAVLLPQVQAGQSGTARQQRLQPGVRQLGGGPLATAHLQPGLEKTRVKKKPAQWFFFVGFFGCFLVFFWVFLGFYWVLLVFFLYLPRKESFFSFKNTFRCIQTLNYNHSY